MKKSIRIGTRGSQLALTQANSISESLKKIFPDLQIEVKTFKTQGDKILNLSLNKLEGKGFFTKELEEALLKKEIDVAVHSAKDLPSKLIDGLILGPVPDKEESADIFISHEPVKMKDLADGSRVGTSSLRRKAQLAGINPLWKIVDLRGNVDTRLRKLEEGFFEGIIVALAGVKRLGLLEEWPNREILNEKEFLPAPCQGTLGLEIREKDLETLEILKPLNHRPSELRLRAERAFLDGVQGGCQVPIGISSHFQEDKLALIGAIFSLDGKEAVRWSTFGDKEKPEEVGKELAEWLLNAGGKEILEKIRHEEKR